MKIIIADDDSLIRESLNIILGIDKDIEVVKTFENGKDASDFILCNKIDVALLDVRMPVMNGVDAAKIIKDNTDTKVVILTTFDEKEYIDKAMAYGANGYLLKNTKPDKIIDTIKMVYAGNSVIQQEVLEKITMGIKSKEIEELDTNIFTQRELDIIKEITKGSSNKEISKSIYISEGTVRNYITSILQKTGLEHRTQIAIKYLGKV
ncbi:MAG: response regulator transcription factor [Sarcina sp.]